MAEIKVYKLVSSEEIIGEFVTSDTNEILLTRIRTIHMVQTGPQSVGPALLPFAVSNADGPIGIRKSAVVANITPVKEIEDIYLQQVSGIQIATNAPPPSKIVTK